MTDSQQKQEAPPSSFVEGLRDIQSQYMMLADLYEKEKIYTARLTEMVKTLQQEADEVISLRPQYLGEKVQAAYLASDAVVVMFDIHRHMSSRPLGDFPANVIVSAIEDCTSALGKEIADKRVKGQERVESLDKVLRELRKAQATFRQAKGEPPRTERAIAAPEQVKAPEPEKPQVVEAIPEPAPEPVAVEVPPENAYKFVGSYGDKPELEEIA